MKVSIVTVCWNAGKTLERAIRSVAAQTHPDIEYIVVDGGSTDATREIIERHRDVIARYVSEPDRGIYDAMNKGLRMATGEVVGILNADDFYYPEAVAHAVRYLESGYDYVFGAVRIGDRTLARFQPEKAWYTNGFATKQTVGFFVRRECHETLGYYDTRYRISADLDFFYRLLKSGYRGVGGSAEHVFGEFTTEGLSSQNWFHNLLEDILIRYNQNQSRPLLLLLINARIIKNMRQFMRRTE